MEKAGCVRRDGKSTLSEFPSLLQSQEDKRRIDRNRYPLQRDLGKYFDREMANRSDNGTLDCLSDEQGEKELGEGWRQ